MRDVNSLPGIHNLRSMFSAKKRSIPRVQSSAYLDLYMMNKEKERLLKESERLGIRGTVIGKRLKEIDLEASKLQGAEVTAKSNINTNSAEGEYTQRNGVKKKWKKMVLSY